MRYNWNDDLIMIVYGTAPDSRRLVVDSRTTPFPPLDVVITDTYVHVRADLPGVKTDDVYVYMQHGRLVIEGVKRPSYPPGSRRKFLRAECQYRPFRRVLTIEGQLNPGEVSTNFENGVLCIKWRI